MNKFEKHKQQQQPPFYGQSTCVSWHLQLKLEGFVSAKFYCPHALAGGNQRIRIREKMLEFSSTVLCTLSPYRNTVFVPDKNKIRFNSDEKRRLYELKQ